MMQKRLNCKKVHQIDFVHKAKQQRYATKTKRNKGVKEVIFCPTFSFHVDAKLGQIGIVAYHKNQQLKCISINESLLLTAPISAVEYHLFGV